jgi:hypothetical protein
MISEQDIRKLPAAGLEDPEELVPIHGTGDPDVVEGCTTVDPIHGAGHIGVLEKALVDELEDVFHAEGDAADEEGGCVRGEIFGRGREWVEGLVAEGGKRFNTIDTVARFGVDVVGGEMVGYVQGASSGASECRISYVPSWDRPLMIERAQLGDPRKRIISMMLPRRRGRSGVRVYRSIARKYLGFGGVGGGALFEVAISIVGW